MVFSNKMPSRARYQKNEAISHFGNSAGVVMRLERGGTGRRKRRLLFKASPSEGVKQLAIEMQT